MSALTASILAVVLALGPASADVPVRADLVVDTSEIGSEGPVLHDRVLEVGAKVFRDGGVLPATSKEDPEVLVEIRKRSSEDPGFDFEIEIEADGRVSDRSTWTVECSLCTEAELVDRVGVELDKVASTLVTLAQREAASQASEEPTSEPTPVVEPEPEPEPQPGPSDSTAMHPLTKAGIGTLVGGVVLAGVGVGLALAPPRPLPDNPLRERYTQPPGYALLAVGGAALVTGTVLVILGAKRRKAERVDVAAGGVRVRF